MPALPLMLMQAVRLEPTLLFGAHCPEPLPVSALITVQCALTTRSMSLMGQKQTKLTLESESASLLKADIEIVRAAGPLTSAVSSVRSWRRGRYYIAAISAALAAAQKKARKNSGPSPFD
jgi:hypothetical protein